MKVTHIITGLGDGGAEGVLYRLCIYDTSLQHTVISLMDNGKYGMKLRNAGIDVRCLNLSRGRVRLSALFRLWFLLLKHRPDVVQTWMYHADLLGGVVARLAGISNIVWNIRHSTLESDRSSRSTILICRFLARLSRYIPRRIIVCAHRAFEVHGAIGYDTGRMCVIANGYDINNFAPDRRARQSLRNHLQVTNDIPLIGMVGRFDPQKDHFNLLFALARLLNQGFDFICVLVGTGLDTDNVELVRQVERLGLQERVRLLGRRDDIPVVMNAIDLHVLSSSSEGFPNVLAEAMACGTPCVTTDVGDAALIVGDTGWVVPSRDPEALAGGIQTSLRIKEDLTNWTARQVAARKRAVDNFNIQKMVAAYHNVWFVSSNQTGINV